MTQPFEGESVQGTKHIFMEKYDESQDIKVKEGKGSLWVNPDSINQYLKDNQIGDLRVVDHDQRVLKETSKLY